MEEEFQLIKDYDGDHGFSLEKGDRVKIIEADDDDPTLLLVQSYDDPRKKGLVPMDFLRKTAPSRNQTPDSALHAKSKKQEAKFKREVCIAELIDTEEEFSKDIQRVVEQYLLPLEEEIRPAPRGVMDSKDAIFNNLRQIAAFHNGIMIGGVKYFLKEPRTIGRTLLRLERDFDEHADYIKNEPKAQEILMKNDEIRDYFEDLSQEIGDDKILADHLKLPLQRINDYTLLLEELIRYSKVLSEDTTDLERALELMLWIPTRSNDLKFITNIEGYHGNIHKLGRLIRHNWFLTKDKSGGKGSERYLFLFKSRILICKVRRISEDRVVFVLKDIVKLPEVDFKNRSDKRTFEVHSSERDAKNFPYTFVAHEDDVKADWLQEIQNHLSDHLTETEHTIDDLKVQLDTDYDPFEPLKGVVLDISPEIEDNLDPIEHPGHRPLKHVPEPKRPPLEAPRKRRPIFECVDPTPSPSPPPEPEPEPEPESDLDMLTSFEEVSQDELVVDDSALAEDTEGEEELVEMVSGKRKPKYIPGKSKPLFHSTIRGSSNEPGENAVFACECEGVDNLVWLKDNRPLSDKLADRIVISKEENVFRLEIKNVCESDSGTYTARAENGCGVSMSTAHLIVEKLTEEEKKVRAKATSPVFSVTLKDTELLESTHARFVVKVNGNPMPEIQFYKGDRLITEDDEFIQIVKDEANPGFYELVLPEVRLEDAGEYKCVASNKYSDESCSCFVNVINEKDVFAGLDEEFTGGEPKFTWLKNGRPFMPEERFKVIYKDEEDSIALVFQNVKPEDAGLYTCVASTSHGRISCSAELTVQGTIKEIQKLPKKAKIEAINKDFDGSVGSTTVIEVKVVGDPLPTARWFRDGEEILASGRHKVIYDEETETASLVIKNLCLEDGGEYNVVARNEVGSDSQFINLHVKAAPKIIKGLKDFTGLTGREIKLEIQVEASPKPIVQWYKDGMMIKKSNRIKCVADEASDTYTLIMENGVMEDAGTYSVVASNEFCQISDVCHLSMESPPQFLGSLQKEVETIEGDYVSFSVMVDGDPLPSVRWKFNGEEIKADGKHFKMNNEGNVFTLLISEVRREDAGQYACEIYNQWGGNECDGHLCVKCPPRFEKELEDKVVKESDMDVEFKVNMNAFPKATVTWYHNETEITSRKKEYTCIEDGETYKLIIKQATTQLSGVYKCKAANEVGTTETSAKLTVHVFPKFTKELSDIEITEGETLKMTVSCKGVPEPDVKWYHNGEEIYSDSRIKISRDAKRIENYNLTITLVQKEDGGEYEVRATNERGTAVTRSLVTVLASTDHKKCVQDEESKEALVNGVGTDDESDKSKAKQVKDEIASKKKIIADEQKKIETNKSRFAGERPTTQSQISTESGDEKRCTIRELCTEELFSSGGNRGVVEEPPENEHYIKIQISRGVSIVSVSESEDFDTDISQTFDDMSYRKCSRNIYGLEEEDQLDLELDRMDQLPHDKGSPSPTFKKHSRRSETIMNEINTNISEKDGEKEAKVTSYSSSRKSSVMEETQQSSRKQDLSPSRKAVSFDKQPSRIYEADNSDAAVEELFKRIQQQRNILGEILESQHEKGQAEEVLKSALKSPRHDSSSEAEFSELTDKRATPKDETSKLNRRQDSWEHLDDTDNEKTEKRKRADKERRDSWEKIDAKEAQDIHVPIQVEAKQPKQVDTPGKQKQIRQDSWELVELADNIPGATERIITIEVEKPTGVDKDTDEETSLSKIRRRRSRQDSLVDVKVTEELDKAKAKGANADEAKDKVTKTPESKTASRLGSVDLTPEKNKQGEGKNGERIIEVELEKPRNADGSDEESLVEKRTRRRSRQDAEQEVKVSEEYDNKDVDQVQTDKPKKTSVDLTSSRRTSRLNSTAAEKVETIQHDTKSGERIIEIEVEKPKKVDSDDEESLVQTSRRRRSRQGAEEQVQVSEEYDNKDADQVSTDKPKRTSVDHSASKRTSRLNSTTAEKVETIQHDGISGERIIEIEVEKPKTVDDKEESLLQTSRRRRSRQGAEEQVQVSEEYDNKDADQVQTDKPKKTSVDLSSSKRTSRLNSTTAEKVETIKHDGISGERIIEIEVEKPKKVDSDSEESLLQKSRRRRSTQGADEEVQVSEETHNKDADQVSTDKPKRTSVYHSASSRTSRLNSTAAEKVEIIQHDTRSGERIIEIEVEKPKTVDDDKEESLLQTSRRRRSRQGAEEQVQVSEEYDNKDADRVSTDKPKRTSVDHSASKRTSRLNSTTAEKVETIQHDGISGERIIEIEVEKPRKVDSDSEESLLQKSRRRRSTQGADEEVQVSEEHDKKDADQVQADKPKSTKVEDTDSRRTSRLNSTIDKSEEIVPQDEMKKGERIIEIQVEKPKITPEDNEDSSLQKLTPYQKSTSPTDEKLSDAPAFNQVTEVRSVRTSRSTCVQAETDIDGQVSRTMSRKLSEHALLSEVYNDDESTRQTTRFDSIIAEKIGDNDNKTLPMLRGTSTTDSVLSEDSESLGRPDTWSADVSDIDSRGVSRLSSQVSRKSEGHLTEEEYESPISHTDRLSSIDKSRKPISETDDESAPTSTVTSRRASRLDSTDVCGRTSSAETVDQSTPGSKLTSKTTSRVASIDDSKKAVVEDFNKDESRPTSRLASKQASRLQSIDDSSKPSDVETAPGSKLGSRRTSRQPSTDDSQAPTDEKGDKSTPTSRVSSRRPSRLQSTEIPEHDAPEDESTPGSKVTSRRTSRVTSIDDSKTAVVEDADKDGSTPTSKLASKGTSRLQSIDDSTKPSDVETAPGSKLGSRRTSRQPSTDDSKAPAEENGDKSTPTSRVGSRRPSRLQSTEIPEQPSTEDESTPGSKITSRRTSRVTSVDDSKKPVVEDTDKNESTPTSKSASREASRLQSIDDSTKPSEVETAPGSGVASRRTSRQPSTDENEDKSTPTSRVGSRRPSRLQSTEIPEQPSAEKAVDESTPGSKVTSKRTSRVTSIDDSKTAVIEDTDMNESTPTSKLASRGASRLQSIDDSSKPSDVETAPGSKVGSRRTSRQPSTDDSKAPTGESGDKSTPTSRVGSRRPSRLQSTEIPEQPSAEDESAPGSKITSKRTSRVTSIDDSKKAVVEDADTNESTPTSKLASRTASRQQSNDDSNKPQSVDAAPGSGVASRRTSRQPSADDSRGPSDESKDKSAPTSGIASRRASRLQSTEVSAEPLIEEPADDSAPGSRLTSRRTSRITSINDSGKTTENDLAADKEVPELNQTPKGASRRQSSDDTEKPLKDELTSRSKPVSRGTSRLQSIDDSGKPADKNDEESTPASGVPSRRDSQLPSADTPEKITPKVSNESEIGSTPASARTSRLASIDASKSSTVASRRDSRLQSTEDSEKLPTDETAPGSEVASKRTSRISSIDDSKKAVTDDADKDGSTPTSRLASKGTSRLQSVDDSTKPLDVETAPGSKLGLRKTSRQPSIDDSKAPADENGDKTTPTSRLGSRRPSRLQSTEIPEQPSAEDAADESTPGSKVTSRRTSRVTSVDDSKKVVVEEADKNESTPTSKLASREASRLQSIDDSTKPSEVETAPGSKIVSRRTSRQPSTDDNEDKSTPTSRVGSRRPSRLQSTEIPEHPAAEDESTPGSKLISRKTSRVASIDDSKKTVAEGTDKDKSTPTSKLASRRGSRLQSTEPTDESKKPTDDESVPGSKVASRRTSTVPSADEETSDKSAPTSRLSSRRPSRLQSTEIPEQPSAEDAPDESTPGSKLISRRTSRITSVDDSKNATLKDNDNDNDKSTPTSKVTSKTASRLHSIDDSSKPVEDESVPGSKLRSRLNSRLQSTDEVTNESTPGSKVTSEKPSRIPSIDDSKPTVDTDEGNKSTPTSRRASRQLSTGDSNKPSGEETSPESKLPSKIGSRLQSIDSGKPIDESDKTTPSSQKSSRGPSRLQSIDTPEKLSIKDVTNENALESKLTSRRTSTVDDSKEVTHEGTDDKQSAPSSNVSSRRGSRLLSSTDSKKPSVDESGPEPEIASKRTSRQPSKDDSKAPTDENGDKSTPSSRVSSRRPSRLQSTEIPEQPLGEDESTPGSKVTSRRTSRVTSVDDSKKAIVEDADKDGSTPTPKLASKGTSRLQSIDDSSKPSDVETAPGSKLGSRRTSRQPSTDDSKAPTDENGDKSTPTSRLGSRRPSRLHSTEIPEQPSAEDESTPGSKITSRRTSRMTSVDGSRKAVVEDADENESTPTSKLASRGASRVQSIDDSSKPSDVETAPGSKVGSRRTSRQPSTDDSKAPTDENGDKSTPTSRVGSRRPSRLQSTEIPEQPSAEDATNESTPGSKLISQRTSRLTSVDDSKKAVVEDTDQDKSTPTSKLTSREASRLQSIDDSSKPSDVGTAPGSKLGSRRTSRQPSTDDSSVPTGENGDKSTPTSRIGSRRPSRLQSTEIAEQPSAENAADDSTPGSKLTSQRTSRATSVDDSKKPTLADDATDESTPTSKIASRRPSRLRSINESDKHPDGETAPGSKLGSRKPSRQPSADDSRGPTDENGEKSTPTSRVVSRRTSRLQSEDISEKPSIEDISESSPTSKLASRRTSTATSIDDSKKSLENDKGGEGDAPETKAAPRRRSRLLSTDDESTKQSEPVSRRTSRLSSTDASSKTIGDDKSTPASRRGSRLQPTDTLEKSPLEEVPDKSSPGSRLTSRRASKEGGDDKDTDSAIRSRRSSQLPRQPEDESEHTISPKQAVKPTDVEDAEYKRQITKDVPSNEDGSDSLTQTVPQSHEVDKSTKTEGDAEYVKRIRKRTSVNEDEDDALTHRAPAPKGSIKSTDEPEAEYTKRTERPTPSGEDGDDSLTTIKYEVQDKPASRLGSKPSSRLGSIDESKKLDDDDEESSRRKRTVRKNDSDTTVRRRSSEDSKGGPQKEDDDDDESSRRKRTERKNDSDTTIRRRRSEDSKEGPQKEDDDDEESSRRKRTVRGNDSDTTVRRRRSEDSKGGPQKEDDDDDEESNRRKITVRGNDSDTTIRRRRSEDSKEGPQKEDDDDEESSRKKRTVRGNDSDTTLRRRSSEDANKKNELDHTDSVEGARSGRTSRLNSLKGKSIKESAELEGENQKSKDSKRKDSEEEHDRLRRRSKTEDTDETKKKSQQMSKLNSVTDDVDKTKSKRRSVDDKGEFPQILSGMDKDIDTFETLTASFEVVGYGTPRPEVSWFKDGEQLTNSKHFVMTEEGNKYKIEIVDLRACDGGVYKAQLTNCVGEASKEATLVVSNVENLRGPKLKEGIQGKTVTKRQTAMLEAKFVADPVPDGTWTVDGKEVIADCTVDVKDIELGLKECTYRMTIPSTDLSDTGTYTVKVKNKHGSAESSDSLTIVMEPIVEVFRDLVVPPTMPCTFEATVMSTPDAEVIWYVNGKQVESDSKYTISSEKVSEYKIVHRLALQDSSLSDEGEYKIVAENNVGKTDATASLKLYTEKPSFVKQLDDRTVQDYDTLHLKVRVNGLPNPEIKWFRDGKEIESDEHIRIETNEEGQVSSTLVIEHFTKDDVAEYKCTAKNIVGEAETSGKLTLAQIEPSFGENLKRVTEVGEGEPLDIITKVIGSPVPTVQWYKDGEEIKPDDARIKTSASPNGQLRLSIDEVTPDDCGAYRAVATNELGKSIANTAVVVTQAPKKPSFIKKLDDVSVVEGEPIKLEVQIDGFPQPTVKWLKDGHTLHACPRMDFISGPNNTFGLTVDKATLQDIGTYSVIISNKCGEESNACNVKVTPANKAPHFQIQLQPVKVVEGYPAKLEVKVDGFPLPKLTWYHNGEPLKIDNDNIKTGTTPEGNQCLLIDKVAPGHAGDYEVVAKNDIGESASKAPLTVAPRTNAEAEHEKPVFLKGLRDITVDESGNFSISAPFRGNPIPDVQWFKDGSLLLPNERIHFTNDGYKVGLEIQDVNMGDQGFYSCALKNPYGEDSTAGHVGVRKLYQSPVFTQRFRHQQQLPKHDAKFHCRVSGVPFPSVVWHRNGQPISNSNKYQIKRDGDVCCLTVFNVNHDDEATYSCIASNREGSATCEAQLQVVDKIDATPKQEPPQFLKKIGDCEIYAGMTAKFTACASGYPEPEYEWFCDTVRLHPSDRYEIEKEGSGLVRLKIIAANPDADLGRYRLRAFNPHGEAFCEANLIFDTGLEVKNKKPIGDLYKDYDRFRATGAPLPLPDRPIIGMMTDRNLRLSWRPSMPIGPREPVTYLVEMEEQPKGKWFTARAGIRNTRCDIHDLKPFVDYKFRVRVENNYGISDPSPFVTTQRERLNPDPPKIRTYLPPTTPFHPDTCHYFPKDFDIERPPHDNYAQAPRFLRQEYDAQYGVKGHNVNLFWFVYGYPKPKITYYFNDEPIEMGGRYDCSYTRNGQATLFINKMMDRDVGVYEAVAVNEHGTARQRVQLRIAEYPEFIKRPEECWVPLRKTCKLEARVIGVPYPEIKWYKDWQPLAPSSRIQIEKIEPDVCILRITDVIKRDEGLYSIGARNIAGSISTSVYVHIEESDHDLVVGNKRGEVLSRNKKFEDLYDLGDELGRGTQGVVYHAVERNTGRNLAAKVMQGTDDTRKWMTNELDIMNHLKHPNIIRPYDSLLTKRSYTILQELASGGDLLDVLTRKPYTSEYEISRYIRQLLLALDHMHDYNIAHLGITPGDLILSHPGSDTLKLTDFGLSRRVNNRKLEPLHYGMPEYVAPEVANGEGVGLSADMWSVGVITHLLLTGASLFRGRNDVDTLDRVKEGRFSLDTDMSADARDFIIKLLMINPNNRMDVRTALSHKWIKMGTNINHPTDTRRINTENLRNYYNSYKDWYSNASCRTWFRRQPLERAYKDPSRMLYPPGYKFTPAPSPEPRAKDTSQYRSWKDRVPSREPLDLEIGHNKSESHYQYGPDTYLLQLRDVDFPCRLREYMKVAKKTTSEGFDWQAPVIRERRRFMDVMDEEIDDERKARINQYGSADIYTLRRLKQEVGSRPTAHVEAEAILGSRIDGLPPFFREKPQTLSIEMEKPTELVCYAVGSPKPIVQWFKNDLVITESQRIKIVQDNEGRSILRLSPACEYDLGIYKVVARNKFGQTVARARLIPASEPNAPEAPEIVTTSDTEVLLKWKQPKDDGNSSILCYGLQYQTSDGKWKVIADNIDHEAWLVHDLEPSTEYQFRLLAMNKIGWSVPGFPTLTVKTKMLGAEKINVPHVLRNMQTICERGKEIIGEEPRSRPDYSLEYQCLQWTEQPLTDRYRFISEIARGRFSITVKAIDTKSGNQVIAKLMETNSKTEPIINREFDILRMMRHERIAGLIEAFKLEHSSVAIFIMEKLQGADVLTYLTSRHIYTEQMVATIVTQVLDGLQYLHWKGYCHLNIQPDNVVMASVRSLQVKLVDFSCAQHVHKLGTVVQNLGHLEFTAPEVLCDEPAYSYSDIWSVGVLTYILLSGVSPYRGHSELETRQNITFVRYRFEYLYKDLSQEATRFIMLLFKRTPTKRPSAEECHEHRWLLPTEYMIKKREKNSFDTTKLKVFSDDYHSKRNSEATNSREILTVIGGRVERSNSIVEELDIMNTSVH